MSILVETVPEVEEITEAERRARILEAAALEIEVRGWCRGTTRNSHGQVCAVGALQLALGWPRTKNFPQGKEVDQLDKAWGNRMWSEVVADFNDSHTAEQVTFLLRLRAAEIRCGR